MSSNPVHCSQRLDLLLPVLQTEITYVGLCFCLATKTAKLTENESPTDKKILAITDTDIERVRQPPITDTMAEKKIELRPPLRIQENSLDSLSNRLCPNLLQRLLGEIGYIQYVLISIKMQCCYSARKKKDFSNSNTKNSNIKVGRSNCDLLLLMCVYSDLKNVFLGNYITTTLMTKNLHSHLMQLLSNVFFVFFIHRKEEIFVMKMCFCI